DAMSNSYEMVDRKKLKEDKKKQKEEIKFNKWEDKRKKKAQKTMDAFLELRLDELSNLSVEIRDALREGLQSAIETAYKEYKEDSPDWTGGCPDWRMIYRKINQNLQQCDLTINLKARNWFSKPNTYTGYLQMYQRGTRKGVTIMQDDDLNPAFIR